MPGVGRRTSMNTFSDSNRAAVSGLDAADKESLRPRK